MFISVAPHQDFYPPKLNPLFTRLCQSVSYPIAHGFYQLDLVVEPACLEKVAAIRGERMVLLPNHPSFDDGLALFLLSARIGEIFNYLVAYESFKGLRGKFFQLVGAYSVRRGLGDRSSIAQTLKLLAQPACRLVIFPEGGCSFQNDTVMLFRTGAIQLPLQAMSHLVKLGATVPNFYVVPVSLKYRYTSSMSRALDATLRRLEETLKISVVTSEDFYERLRTVAEQVIVGLERDYGIDSAQTSEMDWNQRISQLKTHVLTDCEQKLELTPAPHAPSRERVYKIQSVLESRAEELTPNDLKTYESIYRATVRLLNFDAIYDGYVAASPTPERFLDTLTRLEREVFKIDRPAPKGHRKAFIRIGNPVNLKEYFESYKQNRANTVERLTQQLQQSVQSNLDLL